MRISRSSIRTALLFAGTMFSAPAVGTACDLCCAQCGTAEARTKVCRLVCEEKKISVTCWTCEEEDFCLPGPNWPTCRYAGVACEDEDECNDPHPKLFIWKQWKPLTGPKLKTKKRLMKKVATKKVPSYKWVVEDLCEECESDLEVMPPPQGALIPPVPPIENVKVIGFRK